MTDETTVRAAVCGAGGKMGATTCAALAAADGIELVGAVDPAHAGATLAGIVPGIDGVDVVATVAELDSPDVVVDFTHADAARANLEWAGSAGVHAVVGTSGLGDADLVALRQTFVRSNCLIVPNFAIGAVLMMRFAEMAAPFFDTAEIIELHHDNKLDAPSGTAMSTVERMAAASGDWAPDPTRTETLTGARGAEGPAGIRVHSVRMRGMVAHQEVLLGAQGQTLSIRHDSYDRTSFMPGVVLAVRGIARLSGVTVGLDALLDV